jgi:GT2 family glycosyltransferase
VLFVDADDTVARGYVDAMAAALESHELVCASVDMETLNPWNPGGTHPQATGLVTAEMGFLPFAGAGTLGIHRSLFEAVGGFDPLLPCYEEADLCWRLQLAGHAPPAFVPQARLHYRLAEDRTRRWRKAMTFGRTQVLLYSRFRRAGMPRESVGRAAAAWVDLARSAAGRAGGRSGSGVGWHAAVRVGRLVGSIRHGVAYL